MPEQATLERARRDAAQGKSPSTQAGEFVREEIEEIRQGKHGARSAKQAIAIGLSKARRAGVKLPPPGKGKTSPQTRRKAKQDLAKGRRGRRGAVSQRRSRATLAALRREPRSTVSHSALARQSQAAARKRGPRARTQAARKAARTRQRRRAAR